ncbi:hypothetical protein HY388_00795 [Candidatus Daviesbacteria bacterium]|nr:hypothetical protein [Candidatus Daviesbacteria bacterium]
MRNAFTKRLCEIAAKNNNIIIITNDAPTPAFLEFKEKLPSRFINAGLAEANMTGMAAGLALSGKIPITYSIIPFVVMRCYEQVRDDVCYQNVNVKIIGIGGGIVYSTLGGTHTALEDISMMRALPNMTVISPADPMEAIKTADAIIDYKGPVYVRLARTGDPVLYKKDYQFKIGKAVTMKRGKDVAIIGYGPILARALAAADELEKQGISVEVINMHTLKPLDERKVVETIKRTRALVTIEEHSIIGGIYSAIVEVMARYQLNIPIAGIALKDEFLTNYGKQTEILDTLGFSIGDIKKTIKQIYAKKKRIFENN